MIVHSQIFKGTECVADYSVTMNEEPSIDFSREC